MRPLRYSINVTLDGCCDHHAVFPDEDLHRHAAENLARADALLFGRVTYEMMEAAWRPPAGTGVRPDWMEDSDLDRLSARLPVPLPIAIALHEPLGRALAVGRAGSGANPKLRQPLACESDHVAQNIGFGGLLHEPTAENPSSQRSLGAWSSCDWSKTKDAPFRTSAPTVRGRAASPNPLYRSLLLPNSLRA
jgi:hypothetical protein